ncbi:MAG: DUF1538 domain-containing protein [Kineosporiaceae bacterium]|nr:DUF1538 domain-containing protein [Kineosporiaceae bacterium]
MQFVHELGVGLLGTLRDILPIATVLLGFQLVVLRRPVPHLRRVLVGFALVLVGMVLFLAGLDDALFPLGRLMAEQLTDPTLVSGGRPGPVTWTDYGWVYLFAALIGFSTTVAEPALMAVALKAEHVSGGTISAVALRVAVALGVAIGISLGAFRIVTGTPLPFYIITGYVLVSLQTLFAPRSIIALAYDTGGVTTSTVTVPLVAALGLGLASTVPGRNPVLDGFGLIAFASLFPMMTVMAYAQLGHWRAQRGRSSGANGTGTSRLAPALRPPRSRPIPHPVFRPAPIPQPERISQPPATPENRTV